MWPNHRKALYDMGITICLYFGMNKLHKKYWNTSCNIIMASPHSNTMFIVSIASIPWSMFYSHGCVAVAFINI